jgi:hypothetical protein
MATALKQLLSQTVLTTVNHLVFKDLGIIAHQMTAVRTGQLLRLNSGTAWIHQFPDCENIYCLKDGGMMQKKGAGRMKQERW